MNIIVTGGLGFIGINLIFQLIERRNELHVHHITIVDKQSKCSSDMLDVHMFLQTMNLPLDYVTLSTADISDFCSTLEAFEDAEKEYGKIDQVYHLAAESHVDNSITSPRLCLDSNIIGTFNILEVIRQHYPEVRLHHVSTDEVYGECDIEDQLSMFKLGDPYNPSSPYSACKAASDHLVRSWVRTYGIKATISNCGNNFGPRQYFEKFIPHIIRCLLDGERIPVYGDGTNVRDWIYVDDHCDALITIMNNGKVGSTYLVGAHNQLNNLQVIQLVTEFFNQKTGLGIKYEDVIQFVKDRPGHDTKYAIDSSSMCELGWRPKTPLLVGMKKTVNFYLDGIQ